MDKTRRSGLIFVTASAVVFSTAGLFAKGSDASAWMVIFWRGLAAAGFTVIWLMLKKQLLREIRQINGPFLLAALLMAAGTAAFISAFKLTSIAHVALIYAACPFIAAGLSWLTLGERPGPVIMIASATALMGVAVIVFGSVDTGGQAGLSGDLLTLVMTLMMAGVMVVYRRWPDTPAALPAALSSIMLLVPASLFIAPTTVAMSELPLLVLFGLVFAVASVALSEGARRLPAADVALISALETPIAPILAGIVFAVWPSVNTLVGGAVIFVSVIWSQTAQRAKNLGGPA